VGGMLGALVGLWGIPQNMVKNVVEFDCEAKITNGLGKNRPNLFNMKKHLLPNIQKLIEMIPKEDIKVIK